MYEDPRNKTWKVSALANLRLTVYFLFHALTLAGCLVVAFTLLDKEVECATSGAEGTETYVPSFLLLTD